MATENNKTNPSTSAKESKKMFDFAFGRTNYILMIVGIAVMGIGYLLMRGGGSEDPNVFNYDLFNFKDYMIQVSQVQLAGFNL